MSLKRAIVLIGIQEARNLPQLHAVWRGVDAMKEWALTQGIAPELICPITDEDGDVAPHNIEKEIEQLTLRGDLDQLVIYYSGHGINVGYNEFWLLSDAVENGNKAVNLKASEEAARFGSIPHIVFISDACRSSATGIAEQVKKGTSIFPGKFVPGRERAVDIFYATLLGQPALEISSAVEAAERYQAVYTTALLDALYGRHQQVIDDADGKLYIRPRPLKKFLTKYLPLQVLKQVGVMDGRSQEPDARITSDDDAWLSLVDTTASRPLGPGPFLSSNLEHLSSLDKTQVDAVEFFSELPATMTRAAISGDRRAMAESLGNQILMNGQISGSELSIISDSSDRFTHHITSNSEAFGPMHFETGSGFKLKGAKLKSGIAVGVGTEVLTDELLSLTVPDHQAVSTLIILTDGRGVLLPALNDFICSLVFDDDALVDVAFEPCDTGVRWDLFQNRADELRELRAIIASATRLGKFCLEGPDAEELARKMQLAKGVDPALAMYAALAYRDQGKRKLIQQMASYMRDDLGIGFFDIALLAGELVPDAPKLVREQTFPFLPMFTETWGLLSVYDLKMPQGLEEIWQHVVPDSLWTLFDPDGVDLIFQMIQNGEVG